MQEHDEDRGEGDDFELPCGIGRDQRQVILNGVLQEGYNGRADDAANQAALPADHRHHQIFDAHGRVETRRTDEAAHMRVEPSRERSEECGDDEGCELRLESVDAEALDQDVAATQRSKRATPAGIQEIVHGDERKHDDQENEVVDLFALHQRVTADADRRNVRNAAEISEALDIAEQEAYRETPGERAERQEVPLEPQGRGAEHGGHRAGQDDREQKPEPGRIAIQRARPSRRIGRDPDEGRLPEGHDARYAREQRKPDRHQRVDADIVEQADREGREQQRRTGERDDRDAGKDEHGATAHSSSSSSICTDTSERHTSMGTSTENTITSFSELDAKEAKLSSRPTMTAPIAAPG